MKLIIFFAILFCAFSSTKAEYLVPDVHTDRFLGTKVKSLKLDFAYASVNGNDRDCEGSCTIWIYENAVHIQGFNFITAFTRERNKDIPVRMRFGDEILSLSCKLSTSGNFCSPSSTTVPAAALAKKFRNFVGDFAVEFIQESPNTNRLRRDVWATKIKGVAPQKTPQTGLIDDIDYSDLHKKK